MFGQMSLKYVYKGFDKTLGFKGFSKTVLKVIIVFKWIFGNKMNLYKLGVGLQTKRFRLHFPLFFKKYFPQVHHADLTQVKKLYWYLDFKMYSF